MLPDDVVVPLPMPPPTPPPPPPVLLSTLSPNKLENFEANDDVSSLSPPLAAPRVVGKGVDDVELFAVLAFGLAAFISIFCIGHLARVLRTLQLLPKPRRQENIAPFKEAHVGRKHLALVMTNNCPSISNYIVEYTSTRFKISQPNRNYNANECIYNENIVPPLPSNSEKREFLKIFEKHMRTKHNFLINTNRHKQELRLMDAVSGRRAAAAPADPPAIVLDGSTGASVRPQLFLIGNL
uniref:Uncharacterized protein n=1 Tax=Glossina pallidipes TaxID=7398 RepID=A0A1A9ZKP2_GLOPL